MYFASRPLDRPSKNWHIIKYGQDEIYSTLWLECQASLYSHTERIALVGGTMECAESAKITSRQEALTSFA
jgi:hypothetical protein